MAFYSVAQFVQRDVLLAYLELRQEKLVDTVHNFCEYNHIIVNLAKTQVMAVIMVNVEH